MFRVTDVQLFAGDNSAYFDSVADAERMIFLLLDTSPPAAAAGVDVQAPDNRNMDAGSVTHALTLFLPTRTSSVFCAYNLFMGLALVTPKPTARRAEPSWYADIKALEERLLALKPTIINSQYDYGKIIHQLHMMFPAYDHWTDYKKQMSERIGISPRTAQNYEKAYLEILAAGGDELVAAATMENLNLDKEFVRQVLQVAAATNPDLPATELAKVTKTELAKFAKMHKNAAVDEIPTLRKAFPHALMIQRVGKGEMSDYEAWVKMPANKVRGSGLVMASLTYAQLRSVKGIVTVGERGNGKTIRRFLTLNKGGGIFE